MQEAVPYAPPLQRIFVRGSQTVEARYLRPGDWLDEAPILARVEEVDEAGVASVVLTLREAGTDRLSTLCVLPDSHRNVVPDPGSEPWDLENPYRRG